MDGLRKFIPVSCLVPFREGCKSPPPSPSNKGFVLITARKAKLWLIKSLRYSCNEDHFDCVVSAILSVIERFCYPDMRWFGTCNCVSETKATSRDRKNPVNFTGSMWSFIPPLDCVLFLDIVVLGIWMFPCSCSV